MLNVDLNAKDHEGGTAFHYACSNGQLKLAKLLMKNSIEFNIELEHIDNDGRLVSNSDYPMNTEILILLSCFSAVCFFAESFFAI